MALFLADANIPIQIAHKLRSLGHDVKTVQGVEGTSRPENAMTDDAVLDFATSEKRAVITINANDFERLHQEKRGHYGIIVCRTVDGLAEGDLGACRRRAKDIDGLAKTLPSLKAQLVYVPPLNE